MSVHKANQLSQAAPESRHRVEYICHLCDWVGDQIGDVIEHLVGHGYTREEVMGMGGTRSLRLNAPDWCCTQYVGTIDGKPVLTKSVRRDRRRGGNA